MISNNSYVRTDSSWEKGTVVLNTLKKFINLKNTVNYCRDISGDFPLHRSGHGITGCWTNQKADLFLMIFIFMIVILYIVC